MLVRTSCRASAGGTESSLPWAGAVTEARPVRPLRRPVRLDGIDFVIAEIRGLIVADLEDEVLEPGPGEVAPIPVLIR